MTLESCCAHARNVALLLWMWGCGGNAAPAPAPLSVTVVTVTPEAVALSSEWIATLDGFVNAEIRPQVTGYLIKKTYGEGLVVKKGQVMFEIDPRPFQAQLEQATAELAQARAALGKAELDVARDIPLAKEGVIPRAQLDTDIQAKLGAAAAVTSAESAVAVAELNLGFTKVRSLVDGVAAIATAQIGDLVTPSTLLTTVSQLDPIKAYFWLSDQEYLGIADRVNQPQPPKDLWGEGGGPLTLIVGNGTEHSRSGAFLAADREIDPRTGTIRISASFPNAGHVLRPGQFARVRAQTQSIENALLVPVRAVSELQGKTLVRVVGASETVNVRNVTLGKRVGNRWLVERGLQPYDRVIIDGPALKEGTVVKTRAVPAPP